MNDKCGLAVSRRDAIRLIAATPASGAVFATSLPGIASANTRAVAGDARATQGLADLAATHFEPLVGQEFSIAGETVMLTEVRRGPASEAPFRQQFALTFSAPRHGLVPSDIVPVSHPAIGRHDLHVTQIGRAEFEICFS